MMTFSVNNCIQFGESVTRVDRLFLLLRCYILRVLHALFRQTSRAAPHYTLNQDCKNRCYCPSMPTRRQYATSWLVVITNYVMAISRKEKQYKHLATFMVSKLYATHITTLVNFEPRRRWQQGPLRLAPTPGHIDTVLPWPCS